MAVLAPPVTPEEFLVWESAQERKHEFLGGRIFEMPGVTWEHSVITSKLLSTFGSAVAGRGCFAVGSDLKVRIPENGYVYPDVLVVCDPLFEGPSRTVLLNPVVIVEVLSESTEVRDRNEKFDAYASIPSVEEYFLVSADKRKVERFQRRLDVWWLTIARDSDKIRSEALDIELSLDDIYALAI